MKCLEPQIYMCIDKFFCRLNTMNKKISELKDTVIEIPHTEALKGKKNICICIYTYIYVYI